MKNKLLILLIFPFIGLAQNTTINFSIQHSSNKLIDISQTSDLANPSVLFGEWWSSIPLNNGKAQWKDELTEPTSLKVAYITLDSTQQFEYYLFVSPGDQLNFTVDEKMLQSSITVTGKGHENNQAMIQPLHDQFANTLYTDYSSDTLPMRLLQTIEEKKKQCSVILQDYISNYKPSRDFVKNESTYLELFTLMHYSRYKGSQRYSIGKAFDRNEKAWQSIEDSLIQKHPLNNENLLPICDYAGFLMTFLLQEKENIWMNPTIRNNYYSTEEELALFNSDPENLVREKIIDKNFTGKTAEYLYASLFEKTTNQKEDNLPEIYVRFKQNYPKSKYIPYIEPIVNDMLERRKNAVNEKMNFIENSDSIKTFEDVLALTNGKTVFLDMWGTWCGPCRNDLKNFTDSIKNHFKHKALDYVYIANDDLENEEKWKELIAYFNLTGTHILASAELTHDILSKVGGIGFPTYIIIKKDGSYEVFDFEMPRNLQKLYNRLDAILEE